MPDLAAVRSYVSAKGPPPAVVVDVAWVNGLGAIRSLGRAGVPVIALDHRASALGFRSRYCLGLRSPHPGEQEERFVDFLAELGEVLGRPTPIFPTHDEGLRAIARGRERLEGRFLYPFPAWDTLGPIQSKRAQLEAAAAAGLAVPETRHPRSTEEARTAAEELGYPVLVKPSEPVGFRQRFGRQAFRCETADEVAAAYERSQSFEPMVQELIPGGDEQLYTLGSYLDEAGEPLGLFSGRKLLQTPPGIGTCRLGEARWVQEVVDDGLALLRTLRFHGLSQVEFKCDSRDRRFKLMEVNPRLWQWHSLAGACGVDFPCIAYSDLLGGKPAASRMDGDGRRWAITLLQGERPLLVRPPYVEAVFALDDPKPGLAQMYRVLRSIGRR